MRKSVLGCASVVLLGLVFSMAAQADCVALYAYQEKVKQEAPRKMHVPTASLPGCVKLATEPETTFIAKFLKQSKKGKGTEFECFYQENFSPAAGPALSRKQVADALDRANDDEALCPGGYKIYPIPGIVGYARAISGNKTLDQLQAPDAIKTQYQCGVRVDQGPAEDGSGAVAATTRKFVLNPDEMKQPKDLSEKDFTNANGSGFQGTSLSKGFSVSLSFDEHHQLRSEIRVKEKSKWGSFFSFGHHSTANAELIGLRSDGTVYLENDKSKARPLHFHVECADPNTPVEPVARAEEPANVSSDTQKQLTQDQDPVKMPAENSTSDSSRSGGGN